METIVEQSAREKTAAHRLDSPENPRVSDSVRGAPKLPASSYSYSLVLWFIIITGIASRVVEYLSNRSLWSDEAALALNVLTRSFSQLTEQLDWRQAAPILFLWVEKCASLMFGPSEYAFRLVPLLSGVLALALFSRIARYYLPRGYVLLATGLFAWSDVLIRYSCELKQYSTEVLTSLIIYYFANKFISDRTQKSAIIFGAFGAVAIWLSYTATFLLAGMGITLAIEYAAGKYKAAESASPAGEHVTTYHPLPLCMWLGSFLLLWPLHFLKLGDHCQWMESWWANGWYFMPHAVPDMFSWLPHAFRELTYGSLGDVNSCLVFGLFVWGALCMARKRMIDFLFLASPICLVLLAAALHKYPFAQRLVLFLVPSMLIMLVYGVSKVKWSVAGLVLSGILLLSPVCLLMDRITQPKKIESLRWTQARPSLEYIWKHWKPNDCLYLGGMVQKQLIYYRRVMAWYFPYSRIHADDQEGHHGKMFAGESRVWFVLDTQADNGKESELTSFRKVLRKMGTEKNCYVSSGKAVLLYDLSPNSLGVITNTTP